MSYPATTSDRPLRAPALLAAVAGLALTLAACQSGGAGSPSVAASSAASAEASAAESMAPAAATILLADSPLGPILTDADGNTVYLFTPDSANTSVCTVGCIDSWPAVSVGEGEIPTAGEGVTATLGTFARDDGTIQVTVNELPVYLYAGDLAAGDVNGQGVGGNWFVISADGSMNQSSAASSGGDGYQTY